MVTKFYRKRALRKSNLSPISQYQNISNGLKQQKNSKETQKSQGGAWIEKNNFETDSIWVNLKKPWPNLLQVYLNLYERIIYDAWKSSLFVMWR